MPTKIVVSPCGGSVRAATEKALIELHRAAEKLLGDRNNVELFMDWNGEVFKLESEPKFVSTGKEKEPVEGKHELLVDSQL
jgi:hypothetical protein